MSAVRIFLRSPRATVAEFPMSAFDRSAFLAEATANLRLATPLILAQLTVIGMGTVDTVLAGRLGARPLAAVAVGTHVWLLALVVFMGITMAVSPIVAQRIGAGHGAASVGGFVRGALRLALVLGLIWVVITALSTQAILPLLRLDAETHAMAEAYLQVVAWSGLPFTVCFVLRNVAEAHGMTPVALVAGCVALTVNAVVDYALLFGAWGAPELGAVGAAWATVAGASAMLAAYVAMFLRLPILRELRIASLAVPAWRNDAREILTLGLPIAAIVSSEAWLFTVGALLMARFGPEVVAAHQVAINVASLAFMIPMSIAMATTVRVGLAAGAGDHQAVRLRGRAGIAIALCWAVASAAAMAFAAGPIVALYTPVESVATLAIRLLTLAALFQLFDSIQAVTNGALRGIKDTRGPMLVTIVAYWCIGMPLAAGLAFATSLGPAGVWIGFIAGLFVAALGLSLRFWARDADSYRVPSGASVPDEGLALAQGAVRSSTGAECR